MSAVRIEPMRQSDWPAVSAIYEEGMRGGTATFETEIPGWEDWDSMHLDRCRLVARLDERVAGWAALSRVSHRKVYAGVAEVKVYVADWARRRGVGRTLLRALIEESEQAGLWTLQAAIFAENRASRKLHGECGFREVGRRERLGRRAGCWRDVILAERRSDRVGID
jgi:phosphinothricin acetyltransferase